MANDGSIDYGSTFQEFILNIMATQPDVFVRCQNIVEPKYFDQKFVKAVDYVKQYSFDNSTLPTLTDIKVKSGYQVTPIDGFSVFHHDSALNEIEAFCRHKAMEQAMIEGMAFVSEKKYGNAEELMKEAMMVSLQKDLGTVYFADPEQRNRDLFSAQANISTGWRDVDFKLFGGFGTGELEIFVAPSGGGKSVALQNLSLNFSKRQLSGVYITLELKEELVAQRMDSMLTGRSKKEIIQDMVTASAEVTVKGKNMAPIYIKRLPESSTTVHDLRAYLRELQIKTGTKVQYLAVDYLDLLGTPRADSADTFTKDKYVSEELRALAHDLDIVVVTASQLNRSAVEAEEYSHANIAGGLSKIMTADNVIGIRNTAAMRERGEIMFEFMKTRNSDGVGSKVNLSYSVDSLLISDGDPNNSGFSQPRVNTLTPQSQTIKPALPSGMTAIAQLANLRKKVNTNTK